MDLAKALRYSGNMIPLCMHEQSCYVDSARNKIVRNFLSLPPQDATHLLMLDVDISFGPDAVNKTFGILNSLQLDVLFGNYVLGNSGNSIFGAPENMSREASVLVGLQPNTTYMDVWTGGTGWLLMTRPLLERMQKECPGPWHWFPRDPTSDGTDLRGEDISFGLRLYGMNPKPRVAGTTGVVLRHLKLQPFIPDFMGATAAKEGLPALAFPNPYEHDPAKYLINGHHVVDISKLSKEQADKMRKDLEDAKQLREAAKVHGDAASPKAQGEENQSQDVGAEAPGVCEQAPEAQQPGQD
jgi:hypothetical protein